MPMHWIALQPPPDASSSTSAHADLVDPAGALVWWALQFTPLVAQVQGVLLMEVSASLRLFGGEKPLLEQIFKEKMPAALVAYAQGATSLVAIGRLCSQTDLAADDLPLEVLAAAGPHVPTLHRLGCRTWGDVRVLPRGGLARRFGAALVDALDCAYGLRPELYPWLSLPEVFDVPLELDHAVEQAGALLFGVRRLLGQLLVWLRARQLGVLALELVWEMDVRRNTDSHGHLVLRTAQATQDMAHLQRLFAEQLAQVSLASPALHLRLRSVHTQPMAGESWSLLQHEQRAGDSLHQMVERLQARLGVAQVLSSQAHASHVPEQMQSWHPWHPLQPVKSSHAAMENIAHDAYSKRAECQYPSWMLAEPQALDVEQGKPVFHGVLQLLSGPHRMEADWLGGAKEGAKGGVLRDYYVARSDRAGLVWVFRERLGQSWYLHGLFA